MKNVMLTLYNLLKKGSGAAEQAYLPRNFTVEKVEFLKPDTHGNAGHHELFGKWPSEMLKDLIVLGLIEGADHCRCLFIKIARNNDSILSPKHSGMIVAEPITPCLED